MTLQSIKIIGHGVALPDKIVGNDYFAAIHNVSEQHIFDVLGVHQRHYATTENVVEQGARAVKNALNSCNLQFSDLDLLINASVSIAYIIPNTATMVQKSMGETASGVACIDVNLSCLSWLAAFEMAAGLLQMGQYKRIGIVSSEQASKSLNSENMESHALFGDAAAAVIVSTDPEGKAGIIKSKFKTYSDGWDLSMVRGGGLINHPNHTDLQPIDFTFKMQNQRLLLYSLKKLKLFFSDFIDDWHTIDKIVPHQASRAGLDFFTHFYDVEGKVLRNLPTKGNCVAASIPLILCESIQNNQIKQGDTLLMAGTAAGISIGGIVFKF